MKILELRELEDCLNNPHLKEVLLDGIITNDLIKKLAVLGELTYSAGFSPAFFKIEFAGKYIIKGIEGKNTLRIDSYGQAMDTTVELLVKNLV